MHRERMHTNDVHNKHKLSLIPQRSTKNYTMELRFSTEKLILIINESEYVKNYQFNINAVFIHQVYFRRSVTYIHQFYSAYFCVFLNLFFGGVGGVDIKFS